ncbi:hypothetical protein [Paenibacillus sp. IITD108]|uniref:hypothetical protein n=1 Tax=Paenibacillus sp. IITD108 TaxID=3116649 RepID=UPI002F414D33
MTEAAVTYGLLQYCYNCPDAMNCWNEEICQKCWEETGAVLAPPANKENKIKEGAVDATTAEQLRRYWID